jgi:hypothetical protein
MKRALLLLASLAACDENLSSDDGIGNGGQPGCGAPSECQGEVERYQGCLRSACDAQYRGCYGPDYAAGIFNGAACSAWQTCVAACGCDQGCQTSCGQAPLPCVDCILGPLELCTLQAVCAPAQCNVDAGSSAEGGCMRLALCCGTIEDPTRRAQCTTVHQSLSSVSDQVCQDVLPTFCP